MKIDGWDIGVLMLAGWYVSNRLNGGKNDSLNRALIGAGTGIGAAKFGPEMYENAKVYLSTIDRNELIKLGSAAVSAGLGYNVVDVIKNNVEKYKENND